MLTESRCRGAAAGRCTATNIGVRRTPKVAVNGMHEQVRGLWREIQAQHTEGWDAASKDDGKDAARDAHKEEQPSSLASRLFKSTGLFKSK